jgi:hypothetical protein
MGTPGRELLGEETAHAKALKGQNGCLRNSKKVREEVREV